MDLALLPAHEQTRLVREREVSAVEMLDACLAQVKRHNQAVNAVVTLNDAARDEALAIDAALTRGEELGPLVGLPVGIKDVTETAGIRTTYGSKLYADHVPDEDALVVRRFREAGAVILGKTNTPEFAAGANTWNEVFGPTRNPWDPDRSAGGSTGGGAAALATGMISLAQGTDLGGSLRVPASFCGVVGLRPTAGLIPTYPAGYLWDDLHVTGTMARTSADVALSLHALAGPSPLSPVTSPLRRGGVQGILAESGLFQRRFAYCPDVAGIGVDPGVAACCRESVEMLRRWDVEVDDIELDLGFCRDAFLALRGYGLVAQLFDGLERIEEYGVNVAANLRAGLRVTMRELGAAEATRRRAREQLHALFERYAVIMTPCTAVSPFPVEQNHPETVAGKPMETYVDWIAPTFVLSLPGLPVASVPVGLDERGLPVGLQIVGPPYHEARALAIAGGIEAERPIGNPPLLACDSEDQTA
jgi:amidase